MTRLAIITTHPIQYNAPWFKLLNERGIVCPKVFYTWGEASVQNKYDPGFKKVIEWDIPLLEGYDFSLVKNIAADPGSHHFNGIDNPTLMKEIINWKPDAILIFGWKFKSHLKVLRQFKGKIKILFRGDSNLLDEQPGFTFKKLLRRAFLIWVYRHVDKALYTGTANRAYYLAHGLKDEQLLLAPHAIDNRRFMDDINNRQRSELGISAKAIVFIFAGKFEVKKNLGLLLDAFIKLPGCNAHLLLVGNGELEVQLKLKTSLQLPDIKARIHFLPFQNQQQMPGVYRLGDVVVLPSQGPAETWGLTVNEAMACAKAVLVSDKCGCAADLVKTGVNGYVFKSNDSGDLFNKMNILLANELQIISMGKQSFQLIQQWMFEHICIAVEKCVND